MSFLQKIGRSEAKKERGGDVDRINIQWRREIEQAGTVFGPNLIDIRIWRVALWQNVIYLNIPNIKD